MSANRSGPPDGAARRDGHLAGSEIIVADETETVVTHQFAGRLVRGLNLMGGRLVLTDRRLFFVPLISREGLAVSSRAAGRAKRLHDWDIHPQQLLNRLVQPLTGRIEMPLQQVSTLEATRRCALKVTWTTSGTVRSTEFAIFAKPMSPIWNKANVASRDLFKAAVEAARAASHGDQPGASHR
jgi:hypothetical protein